MFYPHLWLDLFVPGTVVARFVGEIVSGLKHIRVRVGATLADLAGTDFSASNLIQLVESLDQPGFISESFSEAARALDKVAERNQGLPQSTLTLLKSWLSTHSQPELSHYRDEAEHRSYEIKSVVLLSASANKGTVFNQTPLFSLTLPI